MSLITNGHIEGFPAGNPSLPGQQPVHALPSAVTAFDRFQARISPRQPAVFLDFDGTLTPIVPRPDMARLSWAARTAVAALAERCLVAIVSGRDRLEVEHLVGLPNLIYAGSHGFDIILPDGRVPEHGGVFHDQALLDRMVAVLRHRLASVPGSLIERKRFTVAVHSRHVPPDHVETVQDVVSQLLKAEHPYVKLTTGKMVYELQPNLDWDKGKAVLWIVTELGLDKSDIVPIFFGDDVTDEHAFSRLKGHGLGVIVAGAADHDRLTTADFRVENPDEVMTVLQCLQALAPGPE
ncbi:Trehalose-6-phosphate phosphatase [invertebrate metagenome]|uniref:trehalose-phosphatase n=1 Tax=invertebrate metagenome TaxID=1711999 RepID=A0A484H6H6_9ZZZZ